MGLTPLPPVWAMLKKTALFLRVGFPYNLYLDSLGYDRTPCLLDSLDNPEACSLFLCGHREQDLRCSLSCTSFLCVFGLPHKIANTCSRSPILSNLVDLGAFERAFLKKKFLHWGELHKDSSISTWTTVILTRLGLSGFPKKTFPRRFENSKDTKKWVWAALSVSGLLTAPTRLRTGAPWAPRGPTCRNWGNLKESLFFNAGCLRS